MRRPALRSRLARSAQLPEIPINRKNRPDFADSGDHSCTGKSRSAVASLVAVWDSECAPTTTSAVYMRLISSPLRVLTLACSIATLALLSAAPADAAPRRGTSGPTCDAQAPVARKLPRHPRSFGGPLKLPSRQALSGLQDLTSRVRRGTHAFLADEVAAIQNDTQATGNGAGGPLTPSLLPLEIVAPLEIHPRSRAFSPRSPRGPPHPA